MNFVKTKMYFVKIKMKNFLKSLYFCLKFAIFIFKEAVSIFQGRPRSIWMVIVKHSKNLENYFLVNLNFKEKISIFRLSKTNLEI